MFSNGVIPHLLSEKKSEIQKLNRSESSGLAKYKTGRAVQSTKSVDEMFAPIWPTLYPRVRTQMYYVNRYPF